MCKCGGNELARLYLSLFYRIFYKPREQRQYVKHNYSTNIMGNCTGNRKPAWSLCPESDWLQENLFTFHYWILLMLVFLFLYQKLLAFYDNLWINWRCLSRRFDSCTHLLRLVVL